MSLIIEEKDKPSLSSRVMNLSIQLDKNNMLTGRQITDCSAVNFKSKTSQEIATFGRYIYILFMERHVCPLYRPDNDKTLNHALYIGQTMMTRYSRVYY